MDRAKCATGLTTGRGPNGELPEVDRLFFNDAPTKAAAREGKQFCNGTIDKQPCPVRDECLAYALAHDERFGVWGGLSERQRLTMHRAAKKQRRAG